MKPIYAVLGIAVVSAAYAGTFPSPQAVSWHEDADSITEVDSVAEVSIESVSDFFLFADEFNTIEQSVRMDMLDYYASGMRKHMPTRLGGQAVIDSIAGDHYMKVSTSSVSETEVQMYVNNHGDKLFGVINRVKMPATDSHISFSQRRESPHPNAYQNLRTMHSHSCSDQTSADRQSARRYQCI